ncbi:pectinesterase inhibitor-like [Coffea arabica]|uniref:Pectinesterase inhibitor-like n=1 Tax=Coffea arabica TaxID=13443 RepID=A0ABM4W8Z1_COFAR
MALLTLRAAPGSNTTDLTSLGQIAINLAKSQVQSIQALINNIEGPVTNQTLRDRLDQCREDFTDVEGDVDGFSDLLCNKDYAGLVNSVDSADDKPTGGDTAFDDGQPPEPDELKQASKHFQVLLEAVGNIAQKLQGPGV